VTGDRERVRQDDDRLERVGWMVKSSRRYVSWEDWRDSGAPATFVIFLAITATIM